MITGIRLTPERRRLEWRRGSRGAVLAALPHAL